MLNSLACVVLAVLSARACAGGGEMYGLVLTHNSPSEVSLAQLDTKGGNWSLIGGQHSVLDGMGDLSAVDTKTQTFYYLGDTSGGTTLLGVSLKDGSEVCQGVIPVAEKGYVGIAQSIDYDQRRTVSSSAALARTKMLPLGIQSTEPVGAQRIRRWKSWSLSGSLGTQAGFQCSMPLRLIRLASGCL